MELRQRSRLKHLQPVAPGPGPEPVAPSRPLWKLLLILLFITLIWPVIRILVSTELRLALGLPPPTDHNQ